MTWIPSTNNLLEVIKAENQAIKYALTKEDDRYSCPCGFYKVMGMPCEHVLRILTQEGRETNVLAYYCQRRYKEINIRSSDNVLQALDDYIEKEKQGKNQNEEENQQKDSL